MKSDNVYSQTIWIGNEEEAVLVDLKNGRLLGTVFHDGYGKYPTMIYASPLKAVVLMLRKRNYLGLCHASLNCLHLWAFEGKSMHQGKGFVAEAVRLDTH